MPYHADSGSVYTYRLSNGRTAWLQLHVHAVLPLKTGESRTGSFHDQTLAYPLSRGRSPSAAPGGSKQTDISSRINSIT